MRNGPVGRRAVPRMSCVMLILAAMTFGALPGCDENGEVRTAVLGALNQLANGLVDAAFLALEQDDETTPAVVTTTG